MTTRATDQTTAGVPFPPPLAFLATLGLGFALHLLFPLHLGRTTVLIEALERTGTALALAALVLAGSAFASLRRARTSPFPERPTTALVVGGPFGFTRNPLYLAMALLHAGIATFSNALLPLLCLVPALVAIRFLVIAREERYLRLRFGAEYEAYCRSVRRWL